MQGRQQFLRIDASAHGCRGADQHAHVATVHGVEELLLVRALLVILHEGYFFRRDTFFHQSVPHPDVGGKSPCFLGPGDTQVHEDHLRFSILFRCLPYQVDVFHSFAQLAFRAAGSACVFIGKGSMPAVGNYREQDIITLFRGSFPPPYSPDTLLQSQLEALLGRAFLRKDKLTASGPDTRTLQIVQVLGMDRIEHISHHLLQLGHIAELGEPGYRLVIPGRVFLQRGLDISEGGSPGIKIVEPALFE